MIDLGKMTKELKVDEGFRDRVYNCSAGKLTIGYGFNLESERMPEKVASDLLMHGIMQRLERLEQLGWFHTLNDTRQRVILNMSFNLGMSGMLKFKKMIQAIAEQDYDKAATEMLNSKWSQQVISRSVRLAQMMKDG